MKRLILMLLVLVSLWGFSTTSTFAQGPKLPDKQPWMFAASEYGLGSVESVQNSFGNFQISQAIKYQYVVNEKRNDWEIFYQRDVSEYLSKHGCSTCRIENYQMSHKLQIDIPVFTLDRAAFPQMQ